MIEFKEKCALIREQLKQLEKKTRELMNDDLYKGEQSFLSQPSEMKAYTMLAVRHIEDARMRVGQILQYFADGVSILDKKP